MLGALLLALSYVLLAINLSSLFWPALGLMVLGHSVFRPACMLLIARATGNDEHARSAVSAGTIWLQILATQPVPCSGVGHATRGLGDAILQLRRRFTVSADLPGRRLSRLQLDSSEPDYEGRQSGSRDSSGNMAAVWLLLRLRV